MTLHTYVSDIKDGRKPGPITQSLAMWDGNITQEAIDRVAELKKQDQGGSRRSGKGRIRGSMLGINCPRAHMLSFLGHLPEEKVMTGIDYMTSPMVHGTQRHYLWQEVGLSAGFLTDIEQRIWSDKWHFGGQVDGILAPHPDYPGKGVLEVKTCKYEDWEYVLRTKQPLLSHRKQVAAYCKVGGFDYALVLYDLRSQYLNFREYIIWYNGDFEQLADNTFNSLSGWIDRKEMPPVLDTFPDQGECTFCRYKSVCPTAKWEEVG